MTKGKVRIVKKITELQSNISISIFAIYKPKLLSFLPVSMKTHPFILINTTEEIFFCFLDKRCQTRFFPILPDLFFLFSPDKHVFSLFIQTVKPNCSNNTMSYSLLGKKQKDLFLNSKSYPR